MRHFSWMLAGVLGAALVMWLCPSPTPADEPAGKTSEQAGKSDTGGDVQLAQRSSRPKADSDDTDESDSGPKAGPAGPPPHEGGPDPAKMKELREKFQKLRELNQKIKELDDAGKTDEAQKARDELQQMRKKLSDEYSHIRGTRGPGGRGPGGPGGPPTGPMSEMYKKMVDLRKQIHDAEEAGDDDKADKLRHEAHDMMRKFREEHAKQADDDSEGPRHHGPGGPGPDGDVGPGPGGPGQDGRHHHGGPGPEGRRGGGPPSFEGRFQGPGSKARQLRVAASLLAAAGYADEAKHVKELADMLPKDEAGSAEGPGAEHHGHGPGDSHPGDSHPTSPAPRRAGGGPPGDGQSQQDRIDKLEKQLHRLSEQLEKLSHDNDSN